jgi:hypothetical protein
MSDVCEVQPQKDRAVEAREAAINLIRVYVERGDTYESLKESWMSLWSSESRVGIGVGGGWLDRCPHKSADDIVVSWLGAEQVCFHFSLRKLYDEIKGVTPAGQIAMF